MDKQKVSIKYNVDEIFACREANTVMPKELEQFCNHIRKVHVSALKDLSKPMDDITKSHSHGINPDDITLKSSIRENLNKINNTNFSVILTELEKLIYTCENHFVLLADELIIKCMNDVMACKGIESSRNGHMTPSELYVNIIQKFSLLCIQDGAKLVKFKTVLTKECHEYFEKMTDKRERMDQNNPHRVSNYKGFMNMMGLLYTNGVFPAEIVRVCLNKIIKLILDSNLSQDDCDNYYSGYERLVSRILAHFEKSLYTASVKDFNDIKGFLEEFNNRISKVCPNEDKKLTSGTTLLTTLSTPGSTSSNTPVTVSQSGTTSLTTTVSVRPLRMFSVMTHHNNVAKFNKLCEIFAEREQGKR
jgi:predicted component of type VI protein secretion system